MPVEHVALLRIQRELHDIPRGMRRFNAYLKTMLNDERDDVRYVPLLGMNPMGREHVSQRLDELLALDAEEIAAQAVEDALAQVADIQGDFKHGLVIMDDIGGGWTNRTTRDFDFRFGVKLPAKRLWITTPWWVSDTPSPNAIRQAVLMSIWRIAYIQAHGSPTTLRQMLAQEGAAAAFAGITADFDPEELDYSQQVIAPHLDSTNYAVIVAALYGDRAASSLGYEALGLSDNAGFALALAELVR